MCICTCLQVYEGEHPLPEGNTMLGKFELSSISLAPHGVPQINVRVVIGCGPSLLCPLDLSYSDFNVGSSFGAVGYLLLQPC